MHSPRLFAHQQMEVISIFILGSSHMKEKKKKLSQIYCLNIQEINYFKPKTTFISVDQHQVKIILMGSFGNLCSFLLSVLFDLSPVAPTEAGRHYLYSLPKCC